MVRMLRYALLVACAGLSACAAVRGVRSGDPDRQVSSAKSPEALRDCLVARLTERRAAGLPAPAAAPGRTFNGYAIDFPPLAHVGVMVLRNEDGSSAATWHATEDRYLGPIGDAARACAAG